MSGIKLTFRLDSERAILARRNLQKGGTAQKYIDSEILRCSDKYIPMYTSMLKKSGTTSTVIGSGMVDIMPYM